MNYCRNCGDQTSSETWYDGEAVCGSCWQVFLEVEDYSSILDGETIWEILSQN